jgi:PAS domain S-box-containing protein
MDKVIETARSIGRLRKLSSHLFGKPGHVTIYGALLLSVFIAGAASHLSAHFERAAIEAGEVRATQHARTAAHQLELTLFNVDRALKRASEEITTNWPASPAAALSLADFPDRTPVQLGFIDSDGMLRESALGRLPKAVDLSDRDPFRIHLGRSDINTHMMPPVVSRLSGRWSIPLSRAVRGSNGELLGVVMAQIDAEALGAMLHGVSMGPDDVIDFIAENNTVWLRWPRANTGEGAVGTLDMSRFVARTASVAGWPLSVRAGLDHATLLREERPVRIFIAVAALVQILMVGVFAFLMLRRSDQLEAQRDTAARAQRDLAAMIDAVPAEIMELDEDRKLKRANSRAMKTTLGKHAALGLPLTEVLDRAYSAQPRLVSPGERQAWMERQIDNLEKCGVFEERSRGGGWRRIYIEPMPGGGRLVLRVDITSNKKREEQLANIFDANGAVILLLDADQRVVLANRAFAAVAGKTPAELVGTDYRALGFGAIPEDVYRDWRSIGRLKPRQPVEFDIEITIGGKPHVMRLTANPGTDAGGALGHIVLIGVDDTARRESEIRMFDSARLANLGEMATGIAHEVNQPLAIMRLAAESATEELEAVGEGGAASAETVEFVESKLKRISQQTERAANIIRDLRTVARKPANQAEPFDLAAAVRVACNLIHEQLRLNRVELRLDLPEPGPIVRGEPARLQQVIMNLINNARDAILETTATPSTAFAGRVFVRVATTEAGQAIVRVEDDGPGISDAALPRLFEPFFTTKPTGKGTGLGLSISYDIVQRMGGKIAAENRAEGGARFTITFDRPAEQAADQGRAA